MPKRKSESLEEDLERLHKKLKKLEKKIRLRDGDPAQSVPPSPIQDEPLLDPNQGDPSPDDPSPDDPSPDDPPPDDPMPHDPPSNDSSQDDPPPDDSAPDDTSPDMQEPIGHTAFSDTIRPEETSTTPADATASTSTSKEDIGVSTDLDDDVLEILGEDPSASVKYGPDIRKELASRFQHIATEGLTKEVRKELIETYKLPANCLHVGAPEINPEIKAALIENVIKRDKGIETKQKEMASAISCLTEVISLQLASKDKNNPVLKKLMDLGRILCDIQHGDSNTRRNFILFAVKNNMQEHLKNTKVDSFLFGEKLSDTLKSAKAVNKSGAELKLDSAKTLPKPLTIQTLNRKAAPQSRRQPGEAYAPRSRQPAAPRVPRPPPPPPPAGAYRTSQTQQQTQTRRRF